MTPEQIKDVKHSMPTDKNKGVALFGRRNGCDGMSKTENEIRIMKPSYGKIKFEVGKVLKEYKQSKDDWVFESLKAVGYTGIKKRA